MLTVTIGQRISSHRADDVMDAVDRAVRKMFGKAAEWTPSNDESMSVPLSVQITTPAPKLSGCRSIVWDRHVTVHNSHGDNVTDDLLRAVRLLNRYED